MAKKQETNQPAKQEEPHVAPTAKQRPIHDVKLPFNGGLLIASIWRNQGDQSHPWYSVTLSRARKETNGKWIYGDNGFSRDQLLGLCRVLEIAHGLIANGQLEGEVSNEG